MTNHEIEGEEYPVEGEEYPFDDTPLPEQTPQVISKTLTITLTEHQWSSLELVAEGDELQGTEELIERILSECVEEFDDIHIGLDMPEGLKENLRNEALENQEIPPGYFDDLIRD